MTSKLVVNTIEADTGISSVSFASSISLSSTSVFHISNAGINIGADTNINRPSAGVIGFNINGSEAARINANGFSGDGSQLTGLPAGLGTALSTVQTSPLNKLYYTDRILSIGSTVTVDHPASATGAYTQYADILVEDNADLIVADGDDLIPDILGLGGNGTTGAGGAGRLLVDNIVNRSGTGAPTLPNGAVVTGVCTATSFVGSGANLTGISQHFKNFGKTTISSSLSTVDIDFDHTNYNNFKLMIIGFNPSADCNMYCRFKINGSYATNNAYTSYNDKIHSGGVDEQIYGNQHQNYGYISNNVGGADGTYERWSAQMTFNCKGQSMGMPFMEYHVFCKDAAGNHVMHRGVIAYQNFSNIEGIRIYPSTGTIDNGTYELYGF